MLRCETCGALDRKFDEEPFPNAFAQLVPASDGPRFSSEDVSVLECPTCHAYFVLRTTTRTPGGSDDAMVTTTYATQTLEPFRKRKGR